MQGRCDRMDRLFIENYDDLADIMVKDAERGKISYAILFYDEAIELMRSIMDYEDISVNSIEAGCCEFNGYGKEYIVSLTDELLLDVEPAWREANEYVGAGYVSIEFVDAVYVDREVNSAVLSNVDSNVCYELVVDGCCDEDEDLDDVDNSSKEMCNASAVMPIIIVPICDTRMIKYLGQCFRANGWR